MRVVWRLHVCVRVCKSIMVADLHYLHQEQQTNNNNSKNISKTEGRTDEQQQQLFETTSAKSIQTKTLSKART